MPCKALGGSTQLDPHPVRAQGSVTGTAHSHSLHCPSANCETQKLISNLPHSLLNEGNQIRFFWSVSPSHQLSAFSKRKHSSKMGVDHTCTSSGCIDFFYPVGFFPTDAPCLKSTCPSWCRKASEVSLGERRDRTQQEGKKEGVMKIKGEIKILNGHNRPKPRTLRTWQRGDVAWKPRDPFLN